MKSLLLLLLLLSPVTALAEDDDTPPWERKDEPEEEPEDEEDGEEPAPEAKTEEPAGEPAAEASSDPWGGESDSTEEAPPRRDKTRSRPRQGDGRPAGDWKTGGPVAVGFSVGTINGFGLKVWPAAMHGIVLNVGVPLRLNSVAAQLSYRLHPRAINIPNSEVLIHPNLGPAFRARFVFNPGAVYSELGGGLAVGASVTIRNAPVEFGLDIVPGVAVGLVAGGAVVGFDVDGLAYVRFFL